MSELSYHELYEQKIQFYIDSGKCPQCYSEVDIISMHERDSSLETVTVAPSVDGK